MRQSSTNDENRLHAVFDRLATHGPLLIVVNLSNTIDALPATVARSPVHQVACLPGLSMRRIADCIPGSAIEPHPNEACGLGKSTHTHSNLFTRRVFDHHIGPLD